MTKEGKNIKIYITHYSKLTERKKGLIEQLKNNNITNYEFVSDYDREVVSDELLNRYCLNNRSLNISEKCNAIAHYEVYNKIVKNNYELALILEDDAILCENFSTKLQTYIEALPTDFEMGFLVDGCNLHAKIDSEKIWYTSNGSRTCCAYLITKQACEKIISTILPFKQAIDHSLNNEIRIHSLKNYWCEPTIVKEGSENNSVYKSSAKYGQGNAYTITDS